VDILHSSKFQIEIDLFCFERQRIQSQKMLMEAKIGYGISASGSYTTSPY